MHEHPIDSLRAAIAALQSQRDTLGDTVLELATAPLRARLAALLRPAGIKHRLVTVLFADVVGSTALANSLEAEDTLGLLSAALRRMAVLIEAHQGRVLRFTGDGVKAAFGMDETREDDAERAVRAGLAILAAGREQAEAAERLHGITDFAVRVGAHSGDVALGAGVEDDNTAMGAAVNIAARMEQHAPPGGLRISHETWSQVRGLFELQAQPPLQVKGIDAPMQTYLVRAALERGAASVERGLQGLATPMVGRDAELQRLLQTVERARQTRQLQALTLIGDAGLGKSRLLREFTLGLTDCRVLTLRSQPDGQLRLFGLLRALLATQCGMADTDSAEVARRKVVDGLSPWFEERGERQAQLIGQLAGLHYADSPTVTGLDPRSLRDQAFAAVRVYLQALAAQGALPVLLVEDLHWADDGSLDLLQHLQAHAAELLLALVMTARPPLLARRPDWATPETTVPLSPLAATDSDTLAAALLTRIDPLPPKLTELIVGRAEGNPYYMEELVRRLIDDGVIDASGPQWTVQLHRLDTLRLPTTLVGLLQARLDALPAADRQAARQASVIGHVFWDDALQALDAQAPQALSALQRAAYVKDRATSDFEGTAERQFDHHLLHQVTYDTLLKAERKLGHSLTARWLQERTQGRGAEFLAMTGEHAERAGETALAIDCFERAGQEASKRFANQASTHWRRRALDLLGESDPARQFDLLERVTATAVSTGDMSAQDGLHAEMAALQDRYPDDVRQARLWYLTAVRADRQSDYVTAERVAQQSFELAQRCGSAYAAAQSQCLLAWLKYRVGDFLSAGDHVGIGLHWAGKKELELIRPAVESQLLTMSAMALTSLGRLTPARSTLEAVLSRCQELGRPREQINALLNLGFVAASLGQWDEMVDWGERALVLARSCGAQPNVAHALHILGQATAALGDHVSAIRLHWEALEFFRVQGDRRYESTSMRGLGVSHFACRDVVAAMHWDTQAQALCQSLDDPLGECLAAAHGALCEVWLGHSQAALFVTDDVLARLDGNLVGRLAHETIELRWICQQVLHAAGDVRASRLLDELHADVQARATELTDAADRERLIQAITTFRDIVAAYGRRDARVAPT
jgi:class 3 adenylate cyclase/tetratricopeptide (TPR) repeat protein